MGMGGAIVLIAVGAILKFATNTRVSGVDLPTIGVILMLVGVVWFVAMLVVYLGRRRTFVQNRQVAPTAPDPAYDDPAYNNNPAYGGRPRRRGVYEERTRYDEPL
jgi:Domain of unknown function (DUF6458)